MANALDYLRPAQRDGVHHRTFQSASAGPTVIRFAGHLPYFKAASALMLPQPLGVTGALATTLAYALVCFLVSRLLFLGTGRQSFRTSLLGTLLVLSIMLLVGPAIALLTWGGSPTPSLEHLMVPFLRLLLPICCGFLAIQLLVRGRAFHT